MIHNLQNVITQLSNYQQRLRTFQNRNKQSRTGSNQTPNAKDEIDCFIELESIQNNYRELNDIIKSDKIKIVISRRLDNISENLLSFFEYTNISKSYDDTIEFKTDLNESDKLLRSSLNIVTNIILLLEEYKN
jgi:hypothetical protein